MENLIKDSKERFEFGNNWALFLKGLTPESIKEAEKSLIEKLGYKDLKGKVFLDIGSGSGLFSLAAYNLGAQVISFDYDKNSVNCAFFLRDTYAKDDSRWRIDQGSVLDKKFLDQFGQVDILYSWGVLHHTGHMYEAFSNIKDMVKSGGKLFISIYNDQGGPSKRWTWIKKTYIRSGSTVRFFLCLYTLVRQWSLTIIKDCIKYRNPLHTWFSYGKNNRGMSPWRDIIDWTGGYPFEVAKPEAVFGYFKQEGYTLDYLTTCAGGLGCNEFVFEKD